jgi:hypothetical protein
MSFGKNIYETKIFQKVIKTKITNFQKYQQLNSK